MLVVWILYCISLIGLLFSTSIWKLLLEILGFTDYGLFQKWEQAIFCVSSHIVCYEIEFCRLAEYMRKATFRFLGSRPA